jgi:hypothetical protein
MFCLHKSSWRAWVPALILILLFLGAGTASAGPPISTGDNGGVIHQPSKPDGGGPNANGDPDEWEINIAPTPPGSIVPTKVVPGDTTPATMSKSGQSAVIDLWLFLSLQLRSWGG